jgi:hypothetical protein
MERLVLKLEGKREDLQCIQLLIPPRHVSLNRNVCGLRCRLRVGYGDEELPFEEEIFLDVWNIKGSKD